MSLPRCWINGEETKQISVFDRGLSYGDGFFTTISVLDGRLLNWSAHYRRIEQSCQRLGFESLSEETCLQAIEQTYAQLGQDRQSKLIAKIILTRGEGGRGYQPPEPSQNSLIIQWSAAPAETMSEISLHLCQTEAGINAQLAGLKHLNRLENVLARQELAQKQWAEGVMLNGFNNIVCATQANIYLIQDKTVLTPLLNQSGVAGTVRQVLPGLLEKQGWRWRESDLQVSDLLQADEVFLSNSVRGIVPVTRFTASAEQIKSYGCEQGRLLADFWETWQSESASKIIK